MTEFEIFLNPICRADIEAENEAEADAELTDRILTALSDAGIEIRGWN